MMARLRQLHPQNYPSSGNINTEFESLIRYLNAAEYGNKTLSELLGQIFNSSGEWSGPIDLRLDSSNGLQFRVGTYSSPDEGWETIAALADIRGTPGLNVGTIEGPFFYNRQDYVATAAQTVFSYNIDTVTDDVMVWKNGLLLAASEYTVDDIANTVTLAVGAALNDKITIMSIRASSVSNFARSDLTAAPSQAVFPFVHTADQRLLVYRNGILQRSGGSNDYTTSPDSDTVTFTSGLTSGDKVTILTVENNSVQNVGGLMLEDEYTDANGLIPFTKLAIADDEIPQAKVAGLINDLADKPKLTVSGTTPLSPSLGDLWQDTSQTPDILKFYDGSNWISTSPASSLPSYTSTNANQFVRVNALGTALEYANVDTSALVPKTYMGAANGVASLDSAGKLPTSQLPSVFALGTMGFQNNGNTAANTTYLVERIYGSKVRLTGWAYKLLTGTCTIELWVDGVQVAGPISVSLTAGMTGQANFGSIIEIDATTTGRAIQLRCTAATTNTFLEVGFATQTLST
jgi:hypothetical protein